MDGRPANCCAEQVERQNRRWDVLMIGVWQSHNRDRWSPRTEHDQRAPRSRVSDPGAALQGDFPLRDGGQGVEACKESQAESTKRWSAEEPLAVAGVQRDWQEYLVPDTAYQRPDYD
jgi:hypothetical protein